MNNSPMTPVPQKRKLLPYILGGCALLSLCLVFACTVNAAYWTLRQRSAGIARQQITTENSSDQAHSPGIEASTGEQIFYGEGTCSACHSLEPSVQIVGPSLSGIGSRAAALASDYTIDSYIYESIIDPNAVLVEGFQPGIMPANYGDRLSEQQLADLVAFLAVK